MGDFNIGDKAVYPGHGVAEVMGLERREIAGSAMEFYVLRVLENDMKVMVPKSNATAVGLRRIVGAQQIKEVYGVLTRRGEKISTATWNRRYREYMEKIKTGSLMEIAAVLRDLCILRSDKDLSFGERKMLDTARTLLVQELALAKGVEHATVVQELDDMFPLQ
ncbi:CarD family transcriptional regulator [Nannocystis sp.]|uniref:CarD family transcriptional regulator n=1 Tax=Nannocystis sp. TaxID=1962667 RepID=UPI0024243FCB|nr:CarD family transcriptional regulator [Nannocystis sp.]MBK7824680.1 CarD family transcriptional regulator [Nannocystis sp.]MBK9753070.1 CarD family transcriptional regulator [Nannocystis sp.]